MHDLIEARRGKRRRMTKNVIERQKRIAESMGVEHKHNQAHRYAKMHSLNCGKPNCALCGNPRKFYKNLTIQEKKFLQGIDYE